MEEVFGYMKEKDVNYAKWYELACWPDDLKGSGMTALDGWHFYNQPICVGTSCDHIVENKEYCVAETVVTLNICIS